MRNKYILKITFYLFCLSVLVQCRTFTSKEFVLVSNNCFCDSIDVMAPETMYFDADSNMIVLTKKEAFNYYNGIIDTVVRINNMKYFPLVFGMNKHESVGYVRFKDKCIYYKASKTVEEEKFLDVGAKIGEQWSMNSGVFSDYKITLDSVINNQEYDDKVYVYRFEYTGPIVSHGYYYERLTISPKRGFLKLTFTNKIDCWTNEGSI